MSSYYTPWTWSEPHQKHYCYHMSASHSIIDTLWSGPRPNSQSSNSNQGNAYASMPHAGGPFPIRYPTGAAPAVQYDDGNNGNEDDSDEDEDEDEEDTEPQDTTREYRIDSPVASPHSSSQTTTHGMQYSAPPSFGYTGTTSSFPSQLAASPAFNYATTITTPYTQRFTSPSSVNYTGSAPGYAPHSSPPQSYVSHPSTLQAPPAQSFAPQSPTHGMSIPGINSRLPARTTLSSLPNDVQANLGYQPRRFIQTGLDNNDSERLDARYRRVAINSQPQFFIPGRVFKLLWTEPAGQANPGKTRNSTHFSTVRFGEQAYSEIRRFVVVRNKGSFSQCIPVQTYRGRGATKPGIVMQDHGVIHTTPMAPNLIPGEKLTKFSIRVDPALGEVLEPASRVNYGKAYAVEHNVKVLEIGLVVHNHRYLIEQYYNSAMLGN